MGRDVFVQFMEQSMIFPVILFIVIAFQGVLAIRMYFATKLILKPETRPCGLNRCRWWGYGSLLFVILSFLDLFTITYLLAFDAYKRFSTIFFLTIINLVEITFRVFGLFVVRKLLRSFQLLPSSL
ncbi:unnamed protein product [Allacma fusca]|uniref:Uncharacterized protein n=1 Tax=Allacma fusca TaxID=39272 RepID=A0A8J2KHP3_9HEXA|nr:unnamed protein product [Allacma fusca]